MTGGTLRLATIDKDRLSLSLVPLLRALEDETRLAQKHEVPVGRVVAEKIPVPIHWPCQSGNAPALRSP